MEEEDKKSADQLCTTVTKLALMSKSADNVMKTIKVVENTCLNNEVTIEELDLQFIPPDVTPDMYDPLQGDDDYTQFLAETFGVPAQAPGNNESAAGDADLLDLDPDFEYRETEDDPNQVGFRYKIVNIRQRTQYSCGTLCLESKRNIQNVQTKVQPL